MRVTAAAVSLNVDDVPASSEFLVKHFGYTEEMSADGFASLGRQGSMNIAYLRRGLASLPEDFRHERTAGVIVAQVVDDLEGELARLRAEGVEIAIDLTVEPWGERFFQVKDPNGVIIQLVDWVDPKES
jgi:catechol 2,3-dioxygenase-like lactoylglutathione lyase family enzyme